MKQHSKVFSFLKNLFIFIAVLASFCLITAAFLFPVYFLALELRLVFNIIIALIVAAFIFRLVYRKLRTSLNRDGRGR